MFKKIDLPKLGEDELKAAMQKDEIEMHNKQKCKR